MGDGVFCYGVANVDTSTTTHIDFPNPSRLSFPFHPSTFSLSLCCSAAPSRRGDLQVLGFCMLHWLCGTLPWAGVLRNPAQFQEAKAQ